MALLRDVLRLQTGDCWAWCQLFSDVVFTNPGLSSPGVAWTESSAMAAHRSAHACMLLTAPCEGALRDASVVHGGWAADVDFLCLLVSHYAR